MSEITSTDAESPWAQNQILDPREAPEVAADIIPPVSPGQGHPS